MDRLFKYSIGLLSIIILSNLALAHFWPIPTSYYSQKNEKVFQSKEHFQKVSVEIQALKNIDDQAGILVELAAEYDVYWDTLLLGGNSLARHGVDKMRRVYLLPTPFQKGQTHLLTFHFYSYESNYSQNPPSYLYNDYAGFDIAPYSELHEGHLKIAMIGNVAAGVFLIAGCYYLFLWIFSHRQRKYLLFGLVCLGYFLLISTEYLRYYYPYTHGFHATRLFLIKSITLANNLLLLLFFMESLVFPYKKRVLAVWVVSSIIPFFIYHEIDLQSHFILYSTLALSFLITLYGTIRKQVAAREYLLGIIAFVTCLLCRGIYDLRLFLGMGEMILFVLLGLTIIYRQERKLFALQALRSERLELQLLKKNIQPHFVLNSLSAAIIGLEEKPQEGISFLHDLAEELQVMNEISGKKLISLDKEVLLCQSYLRVMSYRKEIDYQLEIDCPTLSAQIPPAILQTFLENGITHSQQSGEQMKFTLTQEENATHFTYSLIVHAPTRSERRHKHSGTGIEYVKARLREAFEEHWEMKNYEEEGYWINQIVISKTYGA